jgi:cytochrome c biogenesis protein CcmG/thiol:disulfide interchange protein DsbE
MGIDWGIYGVPETFIIDGEGKVVLRFPGPITERVMDDVIRAGIKKAAAE